MYLNDFVPSSLARAQLAINRAQRGFILGDYYENVNKASKKETESEFVGRSERCNVTNGLCRCGVGDLKVELTSWKFHFSFEIHVFRFFHSKLFPLFFRFR